MTFLELSNRVDEALRTKDLEEVIKFLQKNKSKSEKDLKVLLKDNFPKLNDDDIELSISLM